MIFEPLDFIARLASLIPTPRVNLVRCHGVFAPHHQLRAQIVPAKRGRGRQTQTPGPGGEGAGGACPRHVPRCTRILWIIHIPSVRINSAIGIVLYNKPLATAVSRNYALVIKSI